MHPISRECAERYDCAHDADFASTRPRYLRRAEFLKSLDTAQADAGLRGDLTELAGDTTDDLGPIQ